MHFDPLAFHMGLFWAVPFWTKVVLALLVVARIGSPGSFRKRTPKRR